MMYSCDIEKARIFALAAHGEQFDKAGEPYEGHLKRVADGVSGAQAKVVAWLHDTVEDTNTTIADIAFAFGEDTAHAVCCMTHREGESYETYLARVKSDPIARLVKISDLIDNSNLCRLPHVTLKDVARQAKYNRALHFMMTCCTFLQEDAVTAGKSMETEIAKDYGNEVYMFDDGRRRLLRCKKCGCLMFAQYSEFHGFDDSDYYADFYPVASVEEGDRINVQCGPDNIDTEVGDRFLRRTNGKYYWSKVQD